MSVRSSSTALFLERLAIEALSIVHGAEHILECLEFERATLLRTRENLSADPLSNKAEYIRSL